MFSRNPINTIIIRPTKSGGYFAQEFSNIEKQATRIIENCYGKNSPEVAKKQFIRMGYPESQIQLFAEPTNDLFIKTR